MITLSGVQFAYNGFPVIKGITHSFAKGSFTALLGPNGSGKSTLLRLINGILTPQAGTVEVKGRSAGSISAREMAREMAYVPQMQYNTFPATVFDTVLLGRNPYISWSPGKDDRRITAEILVRFGLDDIALKDLNKLSGGQRQQVFIARALAQQPSVILLDEPTANLDLRHQHEILLLLGELATGGITVLAAIHDLNLALKYCSEFIILDDGQVRAEGGSEIFSEELIEDIYGVRTKIIRHEGEMFILPTEPL
jgi:iron complex transport system ATP-binding protein